MVAGEIDVDINNAIRECSRGCGGELGVAVILDWENAASGRGCLRMYGRVKGKGYKKVKIGILYDGVPRGDLVKVMMTFSWEGAHDVKCVYTTARNCGGNRPSYGEGRIVKFRAAQRAEHYDTTLASVDVGESYEVLRSACGLTR